MRKTLPAALLSGLLPLPAIATNPPPDDDPPPSTGGEVRLVGGVWLASVNGSTVYSGYRMFDAVNAAIAGMNSGTIHVHSSGSSGADDGNVYSIRRKANMVLDFHGNSINANGGDFVVPIYCDRRNNITVQNLRVTGSPRYGVWFRGCSDVTPHNISMDLSNNSPVGLGIRVDASTGPASRLTISGTTTISGLTRHGIETYGIDGFAIGDVTVTNTGGSGVLLND